MKKLIFITLALLLAASPAAYAVNTIVFDSGEGIITISSIDADWTWTDTVNIAGGLKIHSIRFNPGAANDRCIINNGAVTGTDLFDSSVAQNTGGGAIEYYPSTIRYKPVLDVSDGTYNAAAKVTIHLSE